MSVATDFPGATPANARATAENAEFYAQNYEIVVNRSIAARGVREILGQKPQVCRVLRSERSCRDFWQGSACSSGACGK